MDMEEVIVEPELRVKSESRRDSFWKLFVPLFV